MQEATIKNLTDAGILGLASFAVIAYGCTQGVRIDKIEASVNSLKVAVDQDSAWREKTEVTLEQILNAVKKSDIRQSVNQLSSKIDKLTAEQNGNETPK